MDEPFGALDYFTRFKMRTDLVSIWQRERKTIVFVTHDIDEAVMLADRVVVLSARPARVQAIFPVPLSRPRNLSDPIFLETRDRILATIGLGLQGNGAVKDKPTTVSERTGFQVEG
jgi:NitT/TauT family transport system ATP-binding protein